MFGTMNCLHRPLLPFYDVLGRALFLSSACPGRMVGAFFVWSAIGACSLWVLLPAVNLAIATSHEVLARAEDLSVEIQVIETSFTDQLMYTLEAALVGAVAALTVPLKRKP